MKVKNILIAQPEPAENSPYQQLIDKYKVKIDFKPFIEVQGVEGKDLRAQKIDLTQYTAIILNSRNAIDHFFRVAEEMRFKVPDTMKYFCQSEAVANYLQKYITYRKRKIYVAQKDFSEVVTLIKKHKEEKYLFPTSETFNPTMEAAINALKVNWKRAIFYRTVPSVLKGFTLKCDVLVFFSPIGIESLYKNYPDFKQGDIRIATFGAATFKAAEAAGLEVAIKAPLPEAPSMTMALSQYLEVANAKK